jgi:hypothetical protein
VKFHALAEVGSIGSKDRGDLLAGFVKAPFNGSRYATKGIAKGTALLSRAAAQPRVEYARGLSKDLVARAAKDLLATNQHGIGKINAQLCTAVDGDEATDCRTPKEENINKGFAINRVFTHSGTCWRY